MLFKLPLTMFLPKVTVIYCQCSIFSDLSFQGTRSLDLSDDSGLHRAQSQNNTDENTSSDLMSISYVQALL